MLSVDGAGVSDRGDDHAEGKAVIDVVMNAPHNAAVILAAVEAVFDGEHSGTGAAECITAIVAHDAAVVAGAVLYGVDADGSSGVTVLDGAIGARPTFNVACNAADVITACDTGIADGKVLDGAVSANGSEETLVIVRIVIAAFVDTNATDGVALAVEDAVEIVGTVANSCIVVLGAGGIVPVGGGAVGDVCS